LYKLSSDEMPRIKFIIMDKEYVPPDIGGIDIKERLMTLTDPEHPPLISYYRGN
jgi:hypothetical protein